MATERNEKERQRLYKVPVLQRSDRDSNSGYAFDVYTLSRRVQRSLLSADNNHVKLLDVFYLQFIFNQ